MAKKSKKYHNGNSKHMMKDTNNTIDFQKIGVVITRPKEQSSFLIQSIQRNNGVAFSIPCLEIHDPIDIETAKIECSELAAHADYWAFTSPNAVEYAQKLGLDFSLNKTCISIGSGTTKLLQQLTTADIIQGEKPYTTETLLETLRQHSLSNQKISIFSGEGGRRLLENALKEMGADAHYIDVYRRVQAKNINVTEVVQYSQSHAIITLVSSQEAFEAYHHALTALEPNFNQTLIVASERLAQYVRSLDYQNIFIADSAVSKDLWQKLVEVVPTLSLSTTDSITEDSSMTQMNDKDHPETLEESSPTIPTEPKAESEQNTARQPMMAPKKNNHSLSYIAIALGILGIGVGAFSFLQSSQESVNAQDIKRALETQISQQKQEIDALTQSLKSLKTTVETERGQSSDFTNLADAQSQHQQNIQALQQRLSTLDSAITNLQADNGTSLTRYNQLKDHLNEFEKLITGLDQSINQIGKTANDLQNDAVKTQNRLTSQLVEINSKIASLNTLESRLAAATDIDLLNLSQAKYLLRLANFKLMFEDDPTAATKILSEASERLMITANAKFSETTNLIQSEIVKLKDLKTIDRESYAARIQNIAEIIPSIDTKSDDILGELRNTFQTELNSKELSSNDPNAKPWYQKAVDKIKPVFVVTQERTAAPELMSITDEALLKQNLQLQLTTARLALLQNQTQTYQESLKVARSLLTNYFSPNDDKYHQVLSAINELLNVNLTHETLDITPILKSFDASMLNYRGEGL
ncbi:uroporphyrinogen-III C-methyltransferase [Wohlfahrtiimonas larvae]|uniref:Tetrapyrrole biosynthesis uroporphyrinogen III synthase domain-containing protein n=1 Tax=Wohlfahrtiimonas larvae TaxID=1157986 RepID=A0ABP9MIU8_9GAMM|nr:uroporphyrinogen-III C-methyltransferase [Wohlfahrtiimonas larvae]